MKLSYQTRGNNEYAKIPGTSYRDENGVVRKKMSFISVGSLTGSTSSSSIESEGFIPTIQTRVNSGRLTKHMCQI